MDTRARDKFCAPEGAERCYIMSLPNCSNDLVKTLSELLAQVKDEQSYIVMRERTHRNTAESTNGRVKWWSIFQIGVLLGEGIFQVWWLKRFFEVWCFLTFLFFWLKKWKRWLKVSRNIKSCADENVALSRSSASFEYYILCSFQSVAKSSYVVYEM